MATSERYKDMNDVSLKSRILRSLLREYVPDEKQPLSSPLGLSKVVSMIKTHQLLSESFTESMEQKQAENWKSAVDDWVNRLLALVSIDMPDKCWAGISLLGVTCRECSSDRFLASYSLWFQRLLSHIQPPADSQIVKVACCSSISDLVTRLGRFPSVKKDGSSHAGKLIQPVLKLLNEDTSEAVCEGAIHVLCSIITSFPASLHRYYDSAEIAIASKILSVKYSDNMQKKLARCLALLPRSRGDEDSWSLMMQKVLLSINGFLNDAFQGLEEETKCNEATRLLVPPGKEPPPPLGGQTGALYDATHRSERLLLSRVSALMSSCCAMLTSSYPVQVTVPVQSLLALVERVLMVDGSSAQTMLPFMTGKQQELICSELPVLHTYSLQLLIAVIKSIRSKLLPHAAHIVRLVTRYFKKCAFPELRIKVYSIVRVLLISMGVGMAIHLAQEVISNATADLMVFYDEGCEISTGNTKASHEASLQPCNRKRKHAALHPQQDISGRDVEASKKHPTAPISLKIAALEALEALLNVGGALRSDSWRSSIDTLLITTATNSCKGGWSDEESNHFLPNESTSTWADFQLAALRALLASLLSPSRVRPAHLAQSLELFRRGRQEAGTKLAEFCAHALAALELLIHPRALPLDDFPPAYHKSSDGVNYRFSENIHLGGQQNSPPFASTKEGMGYSAPESDDDVLYDRWLENGNDTSTNLTAQDKNIRDMVRPSETVKGRGTEKLPMAASCDTIPETSRQEAAATAGGDVQMRCKEDAMMVESPLIQESMVQFLAKAATGPAVATAHKDAEMEFMVVAADSRALEYTDYGVTSENNALGDKGGGYTSVDGNASIAIDARKDKAFVPESDEDSSLASMPDILDNLESDSDEELSSGD